MLCRQWPPSSDILAPLPRMLELNLVLKECEARDGIDERH
jgi:hypothetical protein